MIVQTWVKVEGNEFGEGAPLEWLMKSSRTRSSLCDIQAVEDGTGGRATCNADQTVQKRRRPDLARLHARGA